MSLELETSGWYSRYYRENGNDRNDLLSNPEVLLQYQATQGALIKALGRIDSAARSQSKVLDVGCGSATTLGQMLNWGFTAHHLHGVDILGDRVAVGLERFPNLKLSLGDAAALPFTDKYFDVVMESTMFAQITDETLAKSIADEMARVTRPGGLLFVADWRYAKPRHPEYAPVSKKRIARLFSVGQKVRVVDRIPGAMVPPLGRRLSRWAPSVYYPTRRLLPVTIGLYLTVLERI